MNILLYKDIFLGFIQQNLENKEHQKQIHEIFRNENSVFVFSKKLFLFIKQELPEDYHDEYQRLFTKFSDLGVATPSSESSQNFDDEILHIYTNKNTSIISIAYHKLNCNIHTTISNIAFLSQQQKPNYHWLVINLAIFHPNKVTLRCFEFSTDSEIDTLFKDIFCIPSKISRINIFDTQCNLNHNKFEYLVSNSLKINYFTKFSTREKNQFERKEEIKSFFGNSAKVYLSKKGERAHGRRIIFEGIVVTIDEDFWNLEINGSDWDIDIEYAEQTAKNWLAARTDLYTAFN